MRQQRAPQARRRTSPGVALVERVLELVELVHRRDDRRVVELRVGRRSLRIVHHSA